MSDGSDDTASSTEGNGTELPEDVIEAATRLTRLARRAVDDAEAEAYLEDRDERVGEYGFRARVREEETRDVLVLYPAEWVRAGTAQLDRIEDTDRAIERTLSGAGEAHEYEAVDEHNRAVVERVRAAGGDVHAANASAFADFMGNHYVREVDSATADEVREFLEEYYPRNAWPSDEQRAVVEASLRLVFRVEDREPPPPIR